MKPELQTEYGRVSIGTREELFAHALQIPQEQQKRTRSGVFTWALTGGSTPQEWYRWCAERRALPSALAEKTHFTVSDERHVPLHSDQSNFGNAERQLFNAFNVPVAHRHPWPVASEPLAAAETYTRGWELLAGRGRAFDVCFLGMGDDGHTASIFPNSPLLHDDGNRFFTAVEVPGKGWRLTITPTGLSACGLIVVMTLGASKAAMIKQVMTGPYEPAVSPIQILRGMRDRVIWLLDEAAAGQL